MSLISLARRGRFVAAVAGALLLVPVVAEARLGGGKSFGNRGTRTEQAVPRTNTAPTGAQPMQRSAAPATNPAAGAPGAAAAAQAARPSMARTMMMGLGAGLLGAGLFGLLSGAGFGGLMGVLGMLAQVALIGGLIGLALRFYRRRSEPQTATAANGPALSRVMDRPQPGPAPVGAGMAAAAQPMAAAAQAASTPLTLGDGDFDAFETLLREVNEAYSNEDERGLRARVTPEVFNQFDEDLSNNAKRGLADRVSDVKLLQGDLAEAWSEEGFDYATVAMRFSLISALYERSSGKVVEGDTQNPVEITELWTFVRSAGGGAWKLSAIQPAS